MKIAITGANSSVGKTLLSRLLADTSCQIIAGVRSAGAIASLPADPRIEPKVISYDGTQQLATTLAGTECVVHLAGILIESRGSSYQSANVDATIAVIRAAQQAGVRKLVFVSVVGADPHSTNAYFRSKGKAEQICEDSGLASIILRTPMLLGPGTAGAQSLLATASRPKAGILGGGHYQMRPLDVEDLAHALVNCCTSPTIASGCYELVGPEAISYRDLVRRTATLLGKDPVISSIPVAIARIGAAITSRIKGGGITPAVIDVITQDEQVAHNNDRELGVSLTPLDQTLSRIIEP